MARVVFLDSGPLHLACLRRDRPEVDRIRALIFTLRANRALVVVPEIADYEVRRELLRKGDQGFGALRRLDALIEHFLYAPISTGAMRRAAALWAEARRGPKASPTAHEHALDGDVILCAQALGYIGEGDRLIVATTNPRHMTRFLDARHWTAITP